MIIALRAVKGLSKIKIKLVETIIISRIKLMNQILELFFID